MKTISKKELDTLGKEIAKNAKMTRQERTARRDEELRKEAKGYASRYKWSLEFIIQKMAVKHLLSPSTIEKIICQRASYRKKYITPKPAQV